MQKHHPLAEILLTDTDPVRHLWRTGPISMTPAISAETLVADGEDVLFVDRAGDGTGGGFLIDGQHPSGALLSRRAVRETPDVKQPLPFTVLAALVETVPVAALVTACPPDGPMAAAVYDFGGKGQGSLRPPE